MSSRLVAVAYGGYYYEYDGDDLMSSDHPCVWPDDNDEEDTYLQSHRVIIDDSDDEDDEAEEPEKWFSSCSLAIPRSVSPTVDNSSTDDHLQPEPKHPVVPEAPAIVDVPVSVAADVVANAHPPALIFFTTPSKRTVTPSARGESPVPVVRKRPGISDVFGTVLTIAPVRPSSIIDTFGSGGLVRGRLRRFEDGNITLEGLHATSAFAAPRFIWSCTQPLQEAAPTHCRKAAPYMYSFISASTERCCGKDLLIPHSGRKGWKTPVRPPE